MLRVYSKILRNASNYLGTQPTKPFNSICLSWNATLYIPKALNTNPKVPH